jgi:hypothetical protein
MPPIPPKRISLAMQMSFLLQDSLSTRRRNDVC